MQLYLRNSLIILLLTTPHDHFCLSQNTIQTYQSCPSLLLVTDGPFINAILYYSCRSNERKDRDYQVHPFQYLIRMMTNYDFYRENTVCFGVPSQYLMTIQKYASNIKKQFNSNQHFKSLNTTNKDNLRRKILRDPIYTICYQFSP